jgi:hypothetical protein
MRTTTYARPFCRLRSFPDPTALDRHLRGSASPATIKNPHPRRPGILWSPAVHLGFHDSLQGALR